MNLGRNTAIRDLPTEPVEIDADAVAEKLINQIDKHAEISESFNDFWDNQEWYDVGADLRIKIRQQFTELRKSKDTKIVSLQDENAKLISAVDELIDALEFYGDKRNWRDVWKDAGKESDNFKYFYRFGNSTGDSEDLGHGNYIFYMGKRARTTLADVKKLLNRGDK